MNTHIKGLIRRDETILRRQLYGFGFSMSWGADDRQFVSMLDGWGLPTRPVKKVFHGHMYTLSGDPPNSTFEDITDYPDFLVNVPPTDAAAFFGGGCLALDGNVYQFLSTTNVDWLMPDKSFPSDYYWIGSKLIHSPDNGRTWRSQDGSLAAIDETYNARSRTNMVFFEEEPQGAFASLSVLQMGRNYELNKDGYVYVYSPNGQHDGTMNELVMFRVHKSRILDRHSYEFFSGLHSDGTASWTRDISARTSVHTFPRGWVNSHYPGELPWAWVPSVAYNTPLGLYMMTSWGTSVLPDGGWFAKPSYLGVWVAPTPWGPFTQIHEELAWTPGNDQAARCWYPQIAPKWISADGKSFWLVWSDLQFKGSGGEHVHGDSFAMQSLKHLTGQAEFVRGYVELTQQAAPNALFNMQRVDLIVQ